MSTPEAAQQALYNRADEVFGKPYSDTLMSALLVNTADLASKADLKILEERFDGVEARFDRLESRFDGLEARFDRLELAVERSMERFLGLYKTIIWAMVALTGIFSAVVGLLR